MTANILPGEFAPDIQAPLWRYMNLAKLTLLVSNTELFFAPIHTLEDPWEGEIPVDLANYI